MSPTSIALVVITLVAAVINGELGYGFSVLRDIHIVNGPAAYLFLLAVTLVDAWLLFRFFAVGGRFDTSQTAVPALKTG